MLTRDIIIYCEGLSEMIHVWPPCRCWPESPVSFDILSSALLWWGQMWSNCIHCKTTPGSVSYLQQQRVVFPPDERYPRLMCTCWYAPSAPLQSFYSVSLGKQSSIVDPESDIVDPQSKRWVQDLRRTVDLIRRMFIFQWYCAREWFYLVRA